MNALLELFKAETKAELEERADATVLTTADIASAILSTKVEGTFIQHTPVFRVFEPPQMRSLSQKLRDIPSEDMAVGKPVPKALLSMINSIHQRNQQTGHFFWSADIPCWWVLHFDFRDISKRNNHWVEGSHVHMLSWLTHPRADPNAFLEMMRKDDKPKLPHPIHIRFTRER